MINEVWIINRILMYLWVLIEHTVAILLRTYRQEKKYDVYEIQHRLVTSKLVILISLIWNADHNLCREQLLNWAAVSLFEVVSMQQPGPLLRTKLTLIPTQISNHMFSKVCDSITHSFPIFNGATVEVWELISNCITHFTEHVTTCPFWD